MKKIPCLFILLLFALYSYSQSKENSYRSANNIYYWKNRLPFPGYWQQDVYYEIKAIINEAENVIDGDQQLTYWNNSPDELRFVYFHLYQNAFQPDSYLDNLQRNYNITPLYGKYESQKLGTSISELSVKGNSLRMELDNTILKVYLQEALKSGDSITFNIKFKTYFDTGSTRRRMKMFNASRHKHFDGVLWYPRICVYDRKFGWSTDQHLNHEFYGDYGAYHVELDFANHYIVEATGNLLNQQEVMPDSLRKKLDIKNFANKPLNSEPSEIIKPDGSRKIWKFYAENVHDFAFTADPTYRIGESEWNGVKCISLAQEPHAAGWQNAAEYAAKVIEIYSKDIGMYIYPKIIVADAQDGMEYPMLTLDGGVDPDYRYLFCHEIGHNWFYGMVGNNETYRAALDEGFTQFLTSWSMSKLEGEFEKVPDNYPDYIKIFYEPRPIRDKIVYYGYLVDAVRYNDPCLNTHSDQFPSPLNKRAGYRNVYMKTATMLYNLQYVLGDELFLKAFQNYFNQWKLCHPYFEDFRNSIIHYTKVDLNWFFDQWLETSKHIDYSIKNISKLDSQDTYEITLERKGDMQMPIDFTIVSESGKKYNYHVPNNWFIKNTSATILPKWHGWDKLHPTYKARIILDENIDNVYIDTTHRLADINMLNNSYKFPVKYNFDSQVFNYPDWTKYNIKVRPDIWYNYYDGFKIGFHINGNYMHYKHILGLSFWVNSGVAQKSYSEAVHINQFDNVSYRFNYRNTINKFSRNSVISLSAKSLDGLQAYTAGFEKSDNSLTNKIYINLKSMHRADSTDLTYLLYPDEWEAAKYNNTITLGFEHKYSYKFGRGNINLRLRSNTLGSDYTYSYLSLAVINHNTLGKIDLRTRTFAQYGIGQAVPKESYLFLAGANPEELMENKYTRSQGFVDNTWLGYGFNTNHFHAGGGLNLRGYAGYLATQKDKNANATIIYKGTSGASVSAELEFDRLLPLAPKLFRNWLKVDAYLFSDAGIIDYSLEDNQINASDLRIDAGLGTAITIKKWGPLQTINPLTLRFDMPLFLNRTPSVEPEFIKFRWIVGISRSF